MKTAFAFLLLLGAVALGQNVRISQLPTITTAHGTAQMPVVQAGSTQQITVTNFFTSRTLATPTLTTPTITNGTGTGLLLNASTGSATTLQGATTFGTGSTITIGTGSTVSIGTGVSVALAGSVLTGSYGQVNVPLAATGSAPSLDFAARAVLLVTVSSGTAFTPSVSGYANGMQAELLVVNSGTAALVPTWPGWVAMGTSLPTTISAGSAAHVRLLGTGTAASNVYAFPIRQ